MKTKLFVLFLLFPALAWGQGFGTDTYTALYRHATDCRANALTARVGQECLTTGTGARYICQTPETGGNALYCDLSGEWVASGGTGGSATPGGSPSQIQWNNTGAFAGIIGATTDGTTVTLTNPTVAGATTITNAGGLSYSTATNRIAVGDGTVARYLHPVLSATSDCQTSSATRTAVVGELCVDQDDGHMWVCKDPSIAATGGLSATLCDGVGDWESAWPSSTEIPFTPTGTISSTTVQAAIAEVASEAAGTQVASGIPFTPTGTVAATNVQTAIAEVASEASVSATRTDPTDCTTNVTTASLGQICTDLDDNQLWVCVNPSAGGVSTVCDVPGDWGAKGNPVPGWQAVMDAGSTFGGAISQATAMRVGNDTLSIYEETWADSGGLHKLVSPAADYFTTINTGKNFAFYRNDGTTALWTLTEAGALTTGSAVNIDNSAAASTKPFRSAAGAAPTTANTCSYDSTANRYKCGNGTTSNTLAWLSEAGGGSAVTVDDNVLIGNGTTSDSKALPNCTDTSGNHLNYTAATNSFSCGSTDSNAGAFTGDVTGTFALSADIAPTILTATANDYAPTSLSTSTVLRVSSDKVLTISGLTGGAEGRVLALVNIGAFPILLPAESTLSTAANRFAFDSDIWLYPNQSVSIIYDATSSNTRWRALTIGSLQAMADPTSRIVFTDDFFGGGAPGVGIGWQTIGTGTAQACSSNNTWGTPTNKAMGAMRCITGTAASGQITLGTWGNILPGLGQAIFGWRVAIEVLSTSSDEFVAQVGLADFGLTHAAATVTGLYFIYDRATAGDFWRIATTQASTTTVTTTSQAVTTQYIWLMGVTNSDWTSVSFFARPNAQTTWNYLGTHTTNIPSGTQFTYPEMKIDKTVSAATRVIEADAMFFFYNVRR